MFTGGQETQFSDTAPIVNRFLKSTADFGNILKKPKNIK